MTQKFFGMRVERHQHHAFALGVTAVAGLLGLLLSVVLVHYLGHVPGDPAVEKKR